MRKSGARRRRRREGAYSQRDFADEEAQRHQGPIESASPISAYSYGEDCWRHVFTATTARTHTSSYTHTYNTQEAAGMKSKGSSSPSIQVERIWGQAGTAGETAIRGAGHGVRMLLYSKMGKQGWAERRGIEDRTKTHRQ